jgi:hypothetical protein
VRTISAIFPVPQRAREPLSRREIAAMRRTNVLAGFSRRAFEEEVVESRVRARLSPRLKGRYIDRPVFETATVGKNLHNCAPLMTGLSPMKLKSPPMALLKKLPVQLELWVFPVRSATLGEKAAPTELRRRRLGQKRSIRRRKPGSLSANSLPTRSSAAAVQR